MPSKLLGVSEKVSASISVITATLNVENVIGPLIDSLRNQSDFDFEWVVADGGSVDATAFLVESCSGLFEVKFDSQRDNGIYDALNRAIALSSNSYYLVVGADDVLNFDAIENFKKAILETSADLISARSTVRGQLVRRRSRKEWLYGWFAHVDSHAVGLLIRKKLHERVGVYNTGYRLAADQDFVLSAVHSGAKVARVDHVSGEYSPHGSSGSNIGTTLTESFLVQVSHGHNVLVQSGLLFLRLMRHRNRLVVRR